ncbi:lipocalin family protein [Aquimarina brevivitae]|uniref:Lipocalin-like protein n=1 Tax=Aquimarina brevivitae TaxID=323412 RepID=A0A4Q7NXV0_9FLAO|nr:lipocalin family protein [Aquimarina brevivitae]RZS92241.1 lipocalin-like protein [Aquimarina brevivitae]
MMKNINYFVLLLLIVTSFGCSSDDDGTLTVDESLIPGTWEVTSVVSNDGRFSGTVENIPITGSFTAEGKNYTAVITFVEGTGEAANTYTSTGGFSLDITVQIPTQDPVVVEEDFPDYLGSGTWSVEGNNLITVTLDQQTNFTITNLTTDTMALAVSLDEEVVVDNTTFTLDGTLEITLSKN